MVREITIAAFLAAFPQFTAKRDICKELHTGCGISFVGAQNAMEEIKRAQQHNEEISNRIVE